MKAKQTSNVIFVINITETEILGQQEKTRKISFEKGKFVGDVSTAAAYILVESIRASKQRVQC